MVYFYIFNDLNKNGIYVNTIFRIKKISDKHLFVQTIYNNIINGEVLEYEKPSKLNIDLKNITTLINKYNERADKVEQEKTMGFHTNSSQAGGYILETAEENEYDE